MYCGLHCAGRAFGCAGPGNLGGNCQNAGAVSASPGGCCWPRKRSGTRRRTAGSGRTGGPDTQVTQRAMAGFDQPQVLYQIDVLEQDGRRYFTYYAFGKSRGSLLLKLYCPGIFYAYYGGNSSIWRPAGAAVCCSIPFGGNWNRQRDLEARVGSHFTGLLWTGEIHHFLDSSRNGIATYGHLQP